MAKPLAALALLANAFAWGVSWWPFRELQQQGVHPLWATTLIYVSVLAGLLLIQPSCWRSFLNTPLLWALALAAGLTNMGFNWAVTVGDVVRVVLLFYLMPAWVVLLAWPVLGERPSTGSLWRMGLALVGVMIILKTPEASWPWPHSLADWLALLAGLCFALTNILLRKLKDAPPSACVVAMFSGGAVMAATAAWIGMQWGVVNALPALATPWLVWVGALGVMFLLGNLGLQYGAARLSASTTSIIMLTEIIFASVSAVALGAGEISPQLLAGGACILAASILSILLPTNVTKP